MKEVKAMQSFIDTALENKKSSRWKSLDTAPKDRQILIANKSKYRYNHVVVQWVEISECGYWGKSGGGIKNFGDDKVQVNSETLWTEIPD